MSAPMRVAVLGAGSVGREVVRALLERADELRAADGSPIVLAGVAVRDVGRAAAAGIPEALLTDAPAHLLADPDTDVIIELMGGDEPAHTFISAALAAGKPVVTANKHVIAYHGAELEATARRIGTPLRFEAAVGGGIPVLGPIAADLAANRLDAVRGIVNGTTNFILTAMSRDARPYTDVLAEAQAAGYAEADPTGDVEGHDAANKLVILARLAFGQWLEPVTIRLAPSAVGGSPGLPGITGVTLPDIEAAAAEGFAIKLIAAAVRTPAGIQASVLPSAVERESPLGQTDGVLNRIEVDGWPIGSVAFAGPGAGGAATSSAVLADLVALSRQGGSTWAGLGTASGPAAALAPLDGDVFVGPSGSAYPVIR